MHLLDKLRWEISGFQRSQRSMSFHRHLLPAYHAFNCAVTAWHMTDWIWEYAGAEFQALYKPDKHVKPLRAFQDATAQASRAVKACREIANGSKHREVRDKRADPYVQAGATSADLKPGRAGTRSGTVWVITDQFGTRPALEVFKEAAQYWHCFLAPWREDSFVSGRATRRIQR